MYTINSDRIKYTFSRKTSKDGKVYFKVYYKGSPQMLYFVNEVSESDAFEATQNIVDLLNDMWYNKEGYREMTKESVEK